MNDDNLEAIWNNIPAGDYGDGKDVSCELLKRDSETGKLYAKKDRADWVLIWWKVDE